MGRSKPVLESRSPTRIYTRDCDVVSCLETTVQAGTELSRGDLWCSLFRGNRFMSEIYEEVYDIDAMKESLERDLLL